MVDATESEIYLNSVSWGNVFVCVLYEIINLCNL